MLPASVAVRFLRSSIRYRRVRELPPARLFVAWLGGGASGDVAAFVRAAAAVAAGEPGDGPAPAHAPLGASRPVRAEDPAASS